MSNDIFTETTSTSWFGRIKESLKGILFGLVLFVLSFALLSWNEGRAVDRSKALEAGEAAVIDVGAERVDPANDGKLVHVAGLATTDERLVDPEFGVAAKAIKLVRIAEMYQWREHEESETRERAGGRSETVTTYRYALEWSTDFYDSTGFRQPEGHENPPGVLYWGETQQARRVTLGGFRLSDGQIAELDKARPLPLRGVEHDAPREVDGLPVTVRGDAFYIGYDPSTPEVGDTRVRFEVVEPATISVVSQQRGDTFMPFATPTGDVELLEYGQVSAQSMFRTAHMENTMLTWGLRVAGFVLMFLGLRLILDVVRIIAAVIPPLGYLVGIGLNLVAGLIAFSLSLVTIAIAWIAQRPMLGIGLLVAGAVSLLAIAVLRKRVTGPAAAGPAIGLRK